MDYPAKAVRTVSEPRNEREAWQALANIPERPSVIRTRHESARAAASIARHRRFKARLGRFLGLAAWLAFLAILGASLAHFLAIA